jgi:hypothetical protein
MRVEVTDAALGLLAHPGAVVADVFGEALSPPPGLDGEAPVLVPGVDGWLIREAGWQLDERFGDEDCDRVEIASVGDEAEALGFEGDRSAAAERVEDLREAVAAGASDLLAGLLEDLLVLGGFPGYEPFDQAEEPLTFLVLGFFGREAIGMGGGVVNELSEKHGPACRERTACPPQVERRGVSVANRLLSGGLPVDRLKW